MLGGAVDSIDGATLGEVDDAGKEVRFSTGVTWSSWGEQFQAQVGPGDGAGSTLTVSAKPKGTFLASKWGEEQHAAKFEQQLDEAIRVGLGDAA